MKLKSRKEGKGPHLGGEVYAGLPLGKDPLELRNYLWNYGE